MAAKQYTIDELKNIITHIAEKYQIAQVYLFGSFARGDYDEESDIDIRIEKGKLKGMFALCGFYTEVSDALDRKVDVLTTGSLSDEFLESIRKDEVMCYMQGNRNVVAHNYGQIDRELRKTKKPQQRLRCFWRESTDSAKQKTPQQRLRCF